MWNEKQQRETVNFERASVIVCLFVQSPGKIRKFLIPHFSLKNRGLEHPASQKTDKT
jgi:hypothetical protein